MSLPGGVDVCLSPDTDIVLMLARSVAVEYFDSGAVLLDLRTRTLTELDARQSCILRYLDGQRTLAEVAKDYAATCGSLYGEAVAAVHALCEQLLQERSLRLVRGSWKGYIVDTNATSAGTTFQQNPDVNLREEDKDGALLYNPDTDRVQLLNSSGLYIWKLCREGRTVGEIVAALRADYDEVPEGEVAADVEEFIQEMTGCGFIGTLETT